MWKYIRRNLHFAILAGLFMVGEVMMDLIQPGIMSSIVDEGVLGAGGIGNIGFVIIAAFGGYFAVTGLISVGVISAFIVYAKQFSRPINEIAQIYGQLQTAIAGAERVFAVLDEQNEPMEGDPLRQDDTAEVTFEHVDFGYEPGHPVLRDFTLTVPPGRKVALVGSTGSGKTTVVNLLMRFYAPDSGDIRINGQSIRAVTRASLRHDVAIVLQDTVLFSDTVGANLTYGNADATQAQLEEAVRMSRCRELIDRLPECYDTPHRRGRKPEPGPAPAARHRARVRRRPALLILDEATSNVDTRTEKAIQDAMQQVMRNRTSIVIAHRLSTIRDSDCIVVMDKGRIVESGTHDELLSRKGRYYDLYMTQFAGFAT